MRSIVNRMAERTRQDILDIIVHVGGVNKKFGEITEKDARTHGAQLKSMTGWGPTARVGTIARAWNGYATALKEGGFETAADLDDETLRKWAGDVWVVPPGGSLIP